MGFEDAGFDAGDEVDLGTPDRGVDLGSGPDMTIVDMGNPDTGPEDLGVFDMGAPDLGVDLGPQPFPIVIAYAATAEDPQMLELYVTDTSTSRVKAHPQLAGGPIFNGKGPEIAGLSRFDWSRPEDGVPGLIYRAQQDTFDLMEVYFNPTPDMRPTTPIKLSLTAGDSGADYPDFSPTSSQFWFSQSSTLAGGSQRYVRDLADLSNPPVQFSQGLALFTTWSPSGRYLAFQDILSGPDDRDLWLADVSDPVTGVTRARVNPGANVGFSGRMDFTPDSSRLAYAADEAASRLFEVYIVDIVGGVLGPRERVHPPFGASADVAFINRSIQFAPDGATLAYISDSDVDQLDQISVVDVGGAFPAAPRIVNGPMPMGADGVAAMFWNESGTMLAYRADQTTSGLRELFIADPTGTSTVTPNVHPLSMGQNLFGEQWFNGGLLYYVSEGAQRNLYWTEVVQMVPQAPVLLNHVLAVDEGVNDFEISQNGERLIYASRDNGTDTASLYYVDLTVMPPAPQLINQGSNFVSWCSAPDGRLAVIADLDTPDQYELYLVRDVTAPTFEKISGPLVAGGQVGECQFPPEQLQKD